MLTCNWVINRFQSDFSERRRSGCAQGPLPRGAGAALQVDTHGDFEGQSNFRDGQTQGLGWGGEWVLQRKRVGDFFWTLLSRFSWWFCLFVLKSLFLGAVNRLNCWGCDSCCWCNSWVSLDCFVSTSCCFQRFWMFLVHLLDILAIMLRREIMGILSENTGYFASESYPNNPKSSVLIYVLTIQSSRNLSSVSGSSLSPVKTVFLQSLSPSPVGKVEQWLRLIWDSLARCTSRAGIESLHVCEADVPLKLASMFIEVAKSVDQPEDKRFGLQEQSEMVEATNDPTDLSLTCVGGNSCYDQICQLPRDLFTRKGIRWKRVNACFISFIQVQSIVACLYRFDPHAGMWKHPFCRSSKAFEGGGVAVPNKLTVVRGDA